MKTAFEDEYRRLWASARRTFGKKTGSNAGTGPAALLFLKIMDRRLEVLLEEGNIDKKTLGALPEEILRKINRRNMLFIPPHCRWDYLTAHILDPGANRVFAEALTDFKCLNRFDCPNLQVPLGKEGLDPGLTAAFAAELDRVSVYEAVEGGFWSGLYEYFLRQYAKSAGGTGWKHWFFALPLRSLIFELMRGHQKRPKLVYDPCCGPGSCLPAFGELEWRGKGIRPVIRRYTTAYGQCADIHSRSLCRMHLAVQGVKEAYILENPRGGALEKDLFPGLRADFVVAAPRDGSDADLWLIHCLEHLNADGTGAMFFSPRLLRQEGGHVRFRYAVKHYARPRVLLLLPPGLVEGCDKEMGVLIYEKRVRDEGVPKKIRKNRAPYGNEELLILDGRKHIDVKSIGGDVYPEIFKTMGQAHWRWAEGGGVAGYRPDFIRVEPTAVLFNGEYLRNPES